MLFLVPQLLRQLGRAREDFLGSLPLASFLYQLRVIGQRDSLVA
jgi:hypothetical protein